MPHSSAKLGRAHPTVCSTLFVGVLGSSFRPKDSENLHVVYGMTPIPLSSRLALALISRMPYFSYLSMLFLYETLGWWSGGAEVRKVHFAEVSAQIMMCEMCCRSM